MKYKKALSLWLGVLLLLTVSASLHGCDDLMDKKLTVGGYGSEHEGVSLRIVSADLSGKYLTIDTRWSNETDHAVTYGAWFRVERLQDGEWVDCATSDVSFIEIAYLFEANSSQNQTYSMEHFRIKRQGTYRLTTECYLQLEEAPERCGLWVEFTLTDS